jgi:DNA (cytosine-5)-methyltransferase 1
VVAWAKLPRRLRPRLIVVENVEEFVTWGPLGPDGRPCIKRGGETFAKWVRELRNLGYKVDWREIVAADHGTPTIRKRLFVIARNDGLPIVWPEHSHGKPELLPVRAGKLKPWRTAAEIIDWSIPCPSIFDTANEIKAKFGMRAIRPLAENTLARVARGVKRYVIDAPEPFIVPITHTGDQRTYGMDEPMRTVTTAHRGEHALITPFLAPRYLEKDGHEARVRSVEEPAATIVAGGNVPGMLLTPFMTKFRNRSTGHPATDPLHTITTGHSDTHPGGNVPLGLVVPHLAMMRNSDKPFNEADKPTHTITAGGAGAHLVAAFLAQHNTDMVGHDAREPVSTIVQKGCTQAVVSAGLVNLKGTERRQSTIEEPTPTQTAGGWHIAQVQAFLLKYYGTDQDPQLEEPLHTATTKDRFGLCTVMIGGEPWAIVDIGMRMLTPRELFRAQGFPDTYIIDHTADGAPITKTDQIRMCGNSVCPQVAAAIVGANYIERSTEDEPVHKEALFA